MKVEINQNLIERITSFVENNSKDVIESSVLIKDVYLSIENSKNEYEKYIEDLIDNIQV